LLQARVSFDLIDGRYYSSRFDEHVQVLLTEVGHSDSSNLATTILVDVNDGFPGFNDAGGVGVDEYLGLVLI
jgi:hypothetical protein